MHVCGRAHGEGRSISVDILACPVTVMPVEDLVNIITFPRNKNAALPVRAQKDPLTISGLKQSHAVIVGRGITPT